MTGYPLLLKTPEDVYYTIRSMILCPPIGEHSQDVESLVAQTAKLRTIIVEGKGSTAISNDDWRLFYRQQGQGVLALRDLVDHNSLNTKVTIERFVDMLLGKHRRYGTASILTWKHVGICSRIDQKWARVMQLRTGGVDPADTGDETMDDTIMDILGYACMGIRVCDYIDGNL